MTTSSYLDRRRSEPFEVARSTPEIRAIGWPEAWWWLGVPLFIMVALPIIFAQAPEFYRAWILPEGYGAIELSHFFVPLVGFIIGLRLLMARSVRANRLWWVLILLGTLACFYTAGEEHSWGQHFFHWQTPEGWSEINRQHETNLHNVSALFNMLPRGILEATIVALGLAAPILFWYFGTPRIRGLEPFMPSPILVPVSFGALVYKLDGVIKGVVDHDVLVARPAEAAETFYVLFMLFYLILIARRIRAIERG